MAATALTERYAANQRYLAFLSSLDDPSAGERDLQRLSQQRVGSDPSVKGLNFFNAIDHALLRTSTCPRART